MYEKEQDCKGTDDQEPEGPREREQHVKDLSRAAAAGSHDWSLVGRQESDPIEAIHGSVCQVETRDWEVDESGKQEVRLIGLQGSNAAVVAIHGSVPEGSDGRLLDWRDVESAHFLLQEIKEGNHDSRG